MRPPTKASTIFHLFLCAIFYFFCVSVTTAKAAPPVVDSVSGELADGQSIAITGTSFGNDGPNVIVFDDFESGTPNDPINIGASSAKYGQWDSTEGTTFYGNSAAVSGTQSFTSDYTNFYRNFIQADLPAGNRNTFISWWQFLPADDNWPGEGGSINWKVIWMMGVNTVTDDIYFPGILASSKLIGGNEQDPRYVKWINVPIVKGEWIRQWAWFKGSTTSTSADGDVKYWYLGNSGVIQEVNDLGVNNLKETGSWTQIRPNGFGNQTPNCEPSFDDIYIAAGPNAQARVEIGNAPTYAASTKLTILTPTSWSDSTISATVNVGSFNPGETAYLFVVDADGNISNGKEVVIGGGSELTIDISTLPDAELNTAYSQTLSAFGGESPYFWSLESGTLPTGLSLNSSGVLSGTPTVAGLYDFTVEVTDSATPTPNTDTQELSISVSSETTHTVTFIEGANGSRTGGGDLVQTVNHGSAATAPIITANTGYTFIGWDVPFTNVTSDLTVTAQYTQNSYTLTYTAGTNGSINGTSPQVVLHGANAEMVTALPDTGYHFVNWSDNVTTASRTDTNVTANITVTANFAIDTIPAVDLKINFQPAAAAVPGGYLVDSGAAFGDRGNGYSYGWNVDCASGFRDRDNVSSPDQSYDTLNHMQHYAGSYTWEILLENGDYNVRLVAGDPDYSDLQNINAEGVNIINGLAQQWIDNTVKVTVTDGRLTLTSADTTSINKPCFIEITSAGPANQAPVAVASSDPTSGTAPLTVNFDGSASTDSDGTIVSYSWDFGDGHTATGPTAANVYQDAGNYTATLTVTDNEGAVDTDTVDITVTADQAAYWKLDEGSGDFVGDSSGNNVDGNIAGATWGGGISGSALNFDSGNYVDFGDSLNAVTVPFTVAAWINTTTTETQTIFASDDTGANYYGFWFVIQSGLGLDLSYGDGTGDGYNNRRTKISSTAVPLNEWVHVAAVVRGPTDISLYLNGVDVGGTYSGTGGDMVHNSATARLGLMTRWGHYFVGAIDEVRVYDRDLNTSEIGAMAVATSSVPGDIDQDGDIDLTDAILGLQIATGGTPETISPDGDVGGDSKIGIEEVIYILQSVQE